MFKTIWNIYIKLNRIEVANVVKCIYFDEGDEQLSRDINEKLGSKSKSKKATIYIISKSEDLKSLDDKESASNVIITSNCGRDFVLEAIKYTNYLIYKFDEQDKVIEKLTAVLKKV